MEILEQTLMHMDITEQIFFKIRFYGTYQQNSIPFPTPAMPYSLYPRAVWFEYHPQYRVVWNDFERKAIILNRATESELSNGTPIDFVVSGRLVCSNHY